MKKSKTYKALLIERKPNEEGEPAEDRNRLLFSLIDINRTKALQELYKHLKCDTIDIQERYINGRVYDFIIDDEYMLNGKSKEPINCIALGNRKGQILEVIFGALIICGLADEDGAETSLTERDLENIIDHGRTYARNSKTGEAYEVINYTFEDERPARKLKTAKA